MRDSTHPLVSVVIPAYNADSILPGALATVLAQTYRPLQIIVIDDGSRDGTAQVVDELRDGCAASADDGVSLVCLRQENGGPSKARNTGIGTAEGELIALLDADDHWRPEKIAMQVELLRRSPGLDIVFSDATIVRTSPEPAVFSQFETKKLDQDFFGHPFEVIDPFEKLLFTNFIPTSSVLARRECFAGGRLFNELRRHVEDWELWLEWAKEFRFGYLCVPLVTKSEDGTGLSSSEKKMMLSALDILEKLLQRRDREVAQLPWERVAARLRELYLGTAHHLMHGGDFVESAALLKKALAMEKDPKTVTHYLYTTIRAFLARRLGQ